MPHDDEQQRRESRRTAAASQSHYHDINLLDIKLLSLPSNYEASLEKLQQADKVISDIFLDEGRASRKQRGKHNSRGADDPEHEPENTSKQIKTIVTATREIEEDKPEDESRAPPVPRLRPRIRFATSIPYEDDPESILPAIEMFVRMHASIDTPVAESAVPFVDHTSPAKTEIQPSPSPKRERKTSHSETCHHCTSTEVLQSQKLAQLTAWRKAFMNEITRSLNG